VGIRTFHRDFIDQIRDHLADFALGRCFDPQGNLIEEYVTCYSRDYFVTRGNKKSQYRTCPSCDTTYNDGWEGRQYVLRSYLTDAQVYMDVFCSMFLDEDLALQLDFSAWPDLELDPIAIRDKPIDGQQLPCDKPLVAQH